MKHSTSILSILWKYKFYTITIPLSLIAFLTQILLSGWISLFGAIFELAFFALTIALLFRLIRRSYYTFREYFFRYFLIFSALTGLLSLILWGGVFLSNTFPGALSKITLSNGEKTIVYYQMSHIATQKYYDGIHADLLDYATNGYKLYLEGVLPGTPENQARLEKALGMKISSGTYQDISGIMGMTAQDESLYDGIDTSLLIHADLSVDDIVASLSTGSVRNENPVDVETELNRLTSMANKEALSYIFRGILNASLRYSLSGDGLLDILDKDTVEALLDKRNRIVVDTFLAKDTKNSVFLYGALHFEGIYSYLKSKDPRWEIVSYEPIYPYVP